LQAHWLLPNGPLARGAAARTAFGVGIHGSDVFLAERRAARGTVRRTLADCDFLTGCSPELVERVCALGFPTERARVIPYGVDVATYRPDPARRALWRQRLGVPEEAPLLLGLGRMATKKGFQVLLPELPALLAALPALHVVLAGDGDLLPRFRSEAAPLAGRVHFPGAVRRDTLPDLFRAADAFVLPAVHDPRGNVDGLPNVVLEAMASALPVVATAVSGIPLAVRDGIEGVLVPEGDGRALREALAALLADRPRARRLGEAGRRRAVDELTWAAVADRYRAAYAEGIERRRAGDKPARVASSGGRVARAPGLGADPGAPSPPGERS
jgi:glycosyltransferase involved in cell wall biosynthesis